MKKQQTSLLQKSGLLVGSFLLSAILIELILFMLSAVYFEPGVENKQQESNKSRRIMCVGESTTALGFADSYPAVLQQTLNKEYGNDKFHVINEGVAGTNTSMILASLNKKIQENNPDLIILMMGINDSWNFEGTVSHSLIEDLVAKSRTFKLLYHLWVNLRHVYSNSKISKIVSGQSMAPHKELANKISSRRNHELELYYENTVQEEIKKQNYPKIKTIFKEMMNSSLPALAQVGVVERFYRTLADNSLLESQFKDGVTLLYESALKKSKDPAILVSYAHFLMSASPDQKMEIVDLFRRALASGYTNDYISYDVLAQTFRDERKMEKSYDILKQGIEQNPLSSDRLLKNLINYYIEDKQFDEALSTLKSIRGNEVQKRLLRTQVLAAKEGKHYSETFLDFMHTRINFQKVIDLIQGQGICVVVMQYPNRRIAKLKELLSSYQNLVFVENYKNFQQALSSSKFEDLFSDRFGGDFGHFKRPGSLLISENILHALKYNQHILQRCLNARENANP